MRKAIPLAATFFAVTGLIALLYWLTLEPTDPCAMPQADTGAAILADDAADQDALANRAIILRGKCKPADEENE